MPNTRLNVLKSPLMLLVVSLSTLLYILPCWGEIDSQSALSREALLQNAVRMGQKEEVKMLIEEGANPNQTFPDGISPLHVAVINNHLEIVELLIKGKANINATEPGTSASPLHLSALYGRVDIAKALIQGGADVNALMKFNITPLLVAAQFNQSQMVELLLSHKATLNHADQEGYTALHFSAKNGDEITAKILIAKGANVNLKDKTRSATPLKVAMENSQDELVKLLEAHGGKK